MADSPRWCATCQAYGDHHTDRHCDPGTKPNEGRSESRLVGPRGSGPEPFEACPDGGRCWHECPLIEGGPEGKGMPCWRVLHASPLSGYGDDWPDDVRREHERYRR